MQWDIVHKTCSKKHISLVLDDVFSWLFLLLIGRFVFYEGFAMRKLSFVIPWVCSGPI